MTGIVSNKDKCKLCAGLGISCEMVGEKWVTFVDTRQVSTLQDKIERCPVLLGRPEADQFTKQILNESEKNSSRVDMVDLEWGAVNPFPQAF